MPVHILGVTHHPGFENSLELAVSVTRREQFIILVTAWNVNLNLSHRESTHVLTAERKEHNGQ